jgi:hypothetical protein
MIHNHWLKITHLVVIHGELCWASGGKSYILCWASCCYPWFVMLSQRVLILVCYSVPVGVNHGELYWASGCESWYVMLSQWLWNMMCYADLFVGNHGVIFWGSGCESWWAMICTLLCIIDVFHWANGYASWFAMLSQWFTATGTE